MTRLYRVLSLLEAYDELIDIAIPNDVCDYRTPHRGYARRKRKLNSPKNLSNTNVAIDIIHHMKPLDKENKQ